MTPIKFPLTPAEIERLGLDPHDDISNISEDVTDALFDKYAPTSYEESRTFRDDIYESAAAITSTIIR